MGDACFTTKGFESPSPGLYWQESVGQVVRAAGFSAASAHELAPVLAVREDIEGTVALVHIELKDAQNRLVAQFSGRYRTGMPGETRDGTRSDRAWSFLTLEYLLHGNVLNRWAAALIPAARNNPLASVLRDATSMSHPQGMLPIDGFMRSPPGSAGASQPVELEILQDEQYNPSRVIGDDDPQWQALSWDKRRQEMCGSLLRQEDPRAPQMQTWQLFVNDPSGRRKARYTGPGICDTDAVWFFDFAVEPDRTVLAQYEVDGTLAYRVSFTAPFHGEPRIPSLERREGYVYLEWWRVYRSRAGHELQRLTRTRFKEPPTTAPIPAHSMSGSG